MGCSVGFKYAKIELATCIRHCHDNIKRRCCHSTLSVDSHHQQQQQRVIRYIIIISIGIRWWGVNTRAKRLRHAKKTATTAATATYTPAKASTKPFTKIVSSHGNGDDVEGLVANDDEAPVADQEDDDSINTGEAHDAPPDLLLRGRWKGVAMGHAVPPNLNHGLKK